MTTPYSVSDSNHLEQQYKSCIECFEDTISTFVERSNSKGGLTGGQIYMAFKEAIKNQQDWHASEQQILNDLSSFF